MSTWLVSSCFQVLSIKTFFLLFHNFLGLSSLNLQKQSQKSEISCKERGKSVWFPDLFHTVASRRWVIIPLQNHWRENCWVLKVISANGIKETSIEVPTWKTVWYSGTSAMFTVLESDAAKNRCQALKKPFLRTYLMLQSSLFTAHMYILTLQCWQPVIEPYTLRNVPLETIGGNVDMRANTSSPYLEFLHPLPCLLPL